MMIAQQLYEGVEVGPEGHVGLITYMRTDSTRVAKEAQEEAREYIKNQYGQPFVPETAKQVTSRKGAQDAHEAIRPTSVQRHPDQIKEYLSPDQYKLYKLIWQRFLASQMMPAVFDVVSVDISAVDMIFRATGSTVKFQGFMKVYTEGKDDSAVVADEELPPLPELKEGQVLDLRQLTPDQHFTEPPPRFTEATLVRALEEKGIGRPSTYAAIISTIQDRKYVELLEKKFRPTELGFIVTDQLVKHFPDIMNIEFTAGVETKLDTVEEGELDWVKLLCGLLWAVRERPRRRSGEHGAGEDRAQGERSGLPELRQADAHPRRPLRRVPGLRGLPRMQDHRAAHKAARREVPDLRRGRRAREEIPQGQGLLRLQPLPGLHVRELGQAHQQGTARSATVFSENAASTASSRAIAAPTPTATTRPHEARAPKARKGAGAVAEEKAEE